MDPASAKECAYPMVRWAHCRPKHTDAKDYDRRRCTQVSNRPLALRRARLGATGCNPQPEGSQDERLTVPTLPSAGGVGRVGCVAGENHRRFGLAICRCEDEPHPTRAIVCVCSKVASRYGAAGYKVMRLIA